MGEKEKNLIAGMIELIDSDIERLKKLKEEKGKILSKARIVILSSALLARADGKITAEELYQMHNHIFKRYYITQDVVRHFIQELVACEDISEVKKEVEKYEIEKEFLGDLYDELLKLGMIDGDYSLDEEKVMHQLMEVFDFPFDLEEE